MMRSQKVSRSVLICSLSLSLATLAEAAPPGAPNLQQRPQEGATITPNYKDADLSQIIQAVSEVTGKNFIIDPRVNAKVTMLSATPMSPTAFYEAFLSVPLLSGGEVIGVINVHHREPHAHTADEISLLTFVGEQMGGAIMKSYLAEENARLIEETAEMRRQLETRKLVERAKGILQQRHTLTEEEAYLRLRNESRRLRRPMRELAEAIILSEDLSRKSERIQ